MSNIQIGDISVGLNEELFVIAGPCVIESEEHAVQMIGLVLPAPGEQSTSRRVSSWLPTTC